MEPDPAPDEQIVLPSEVWARLTEGERSRVNNLLTRMTYKYGTARPTATPEPNAEPSSANDDLSNSSSS